MLLNVLQMLIYKFSKQEECKVLVSFSEEIRVNVNQYSFTIAYVSKLLFISFVGHFRMRKA